ncbi:membrane protein [Companilactobacillus sp. RD055328]|nr:membrane protein [Companilactobacillus sp. RD055328]
MLTRKQKIIYEVFNAITHGIGFIASVVLIILLLIRGVNHSLNSYELSSLAIYGFTLLSLYLASTLFHCLAFTRARRIFQIFDHSNIFLLIAGTYTPYCVIMLGDTKGYAMLIGVWVLAIGGILLHLLTHGKRQKTETTIYILMGWLVMIAGPDLYHSLSLSGFWLLVSGGVVFTIGAIIYSFPNVRGMHLIWHFFVLAGTTLMYASIYLNI